MLVVDDRQLVAGQSTSVVYAMGGDNGSPGDCDCHDGISDQVLRMRNPSPTATWIQDVPQLKIGRVFANAVLMLDGSIIVFNGLRKDVDASGAWTGTCSYANRPEMLKPEEIFGVAPTTWKQLCSSFKNHAHHSVAGLLPTGQAFVGGGDDSDQDDPNCGVPVPVNEANHTLEIFSPPTMFQGPAPEIASVSPSEPMQGEGVVDVAVDLAGEPARVALVAPSTMTHSVNFSQRYVMLRMNSIEQNPQTMTWTIKVRIPSQPEVVPPGWYMLTVVDSVGRPSPAFWIRVQAP